MSFQPKYVENKEYMQHKAKYGAPISIRLNDSELKKITKWQDLADIGSQSEAIKSLAMVGYNVLHGQSIAHAIERLFKKERARKSKS